MADPQLQLLEERIVWLQRHVAEQDKAMLELAEELAKIRKELLIFRTRLQDHGDAGGPATAEERPPHY
ncbi:MAG: SlyX family protein [Opitutae bacterium]|nr:SlyX family protein [Opitutae bacterium]